MEQHIVLVKGNIAAYRPPKQKHPTQVILRWSSGGLKVVSVTSRGPSVNVDVSKARSIGRQAEPRHVNPSQHVNRGDQMWNPWMTPEHLIPLLWCANPSRAPPWELMWSGGDGAEANGTDSTNTAGPFRTGTRSHI